MKKTLFLLAMCLFGQLMAVAQVTEKPTATLQVDDQVTVYYGVSALVNAYAAAPDEGGIITLSSGTFTAVNIDKSIEIYGAGMQDHSVGEGANDVIVATTISGSMSIGKSTKASKVTLEGLRFDGKLYNNNSDYLYVNRCYLGDNFENGSVDVTAKFTNCVINAEYITVANYKSIVFYNSILKIVNCNTGGTGNSAFYHCIVLNYTSYSANIIPACSYYHCILATVLATGGYAADCVFAAAKNTGVTYIDCKFSVSSADLFGVENLISYEKSSIVKYAATQTYELLSPNDYIGSDGTQIGIYGGEFAWQTVPSIPRIIESSVSKIATNGYISVGIKAEARP